MLEEFFEHRFVLRRLRASGAAPYLDDFAAALVKEGYKRSTLRSYLRSAAHFADWARSQGTELSALDDAALQAFDAHRPTCRCLRQDARDHGRGRAVLLGAIHFLNYLRARGVVSAVQVEEPYVPAVLLEFETWMRHHRGVRDTTLDSYRRHLLPFLRTVGEDASGYTCSTVRRFVLGRAAQVGRKSTRQTVTAVRMFLRYLTVQGRCEPDLADGIPRYAGWAKAALPGYLGKEAVDRLTESCNDPRLPAGVRDHAVLLLLARLGLRPADVANLRLEDLDWEGARLRVVGKSRREDWLPLPQDAGDAILRYLEEDRPETADEHVFLTSQAPIGPLGSVSVGNTVKRAVDRTDVRTRSKGAYILRHSAAVDLLRQGASLGQIGVVLRHCSVNTTAIYAKVDIAMLRELAQPWPTTEATP